MNLEIKTDDQILAILNEAKNDRKRLQQLEKDCHNELNKRNQLPEIPAFNYERKILSTQNKIDFNHWLETGHRTTGEIIDFVESLLK